MATEVLDPAAYIFEGFWTDWTKGQILGQTWTLCPSHATLLTNSLALFVTLAGGQLWTIIRFSVHQARASRRPKQYSERFLQQQVILRNASTDLHTMRLMSQISWDSRRAPGRQFLFPLLIVVLALVHYTVFVVAGTLSNNLINTGSEDTFSTKRINVSSVVLSRSPHCGVWSPTYLEQKQYEGEETLETVRMSQKDLTKMDRNVQLSLEYVRDCYAPNSSYYMSSRCDMFKRRNIEYDETTYTGPCPFGEQYCHNEQDILVFDTQTIDSHYDLGINSPRADRLTYHRRTTCAVLNDTGRIVDSAPSTSISTTYAMYGPSLIRGTDWTYSWSNFSALYTEFTPQVTIPYHVNTEIAYGSSPMTDTLSTFEPSSGLQQDAADLILLFLGYTGRYFEPVDDPWFSAHRLHFKDVPAAIARYQYERDRPISTLGCLEQHQICNSNDVCTPFGGWAQVQSAQAFLAVLSSREKTVFDRLVAAVEASSIAQVTASLASTSSPLLAIDECATGSTVLSLKIPDDQWRRELRNWHAIALAQLQRTVSQWGTGQIASDPQTQLVPPTTEAEVWFCKNMMVPSTVYQSFSVVWLALIVTAGAVVILISWTIEDISDWLHLRTVHSSALRKIWDSYHMLRLTGFMMRNSWGPMPPPKDFVAIPHIQVDPPTNFPQTIRLVTPIDSRGQSLQTPHSSMGFPPDSHYERHNRNSIPRTWSELPDPPHRDSWVERSMNGFDFGWERSSKDIFHDTASSKPELSPCLPPPPAPPLAILNLKEHALARIRRERLPHT